MKLLDNKIIEQKAKDYATFRIVKGKPVIDGWALEAFRDGAEWMRHEILDHLKSQEEKYKTAFDEIYDWLKAGG